MKWTEALSILSRRNEYLSILTAFEMIGKTTLWITLRERRPFAIYVSSLLYSLTATV